MGQGNAIGLAAELTMAWLANPNTRASVDEVPAFLQAVHEAISTLSMSAVEPEQEGEVAYPPAVSVRKSLASRDQIVSLIDGKPYKALRRHLAANGLTPDAYRERYGLKPDYPMVAPGYSEQRSATAKALGLGRKPAQVPVPAEEQPAPPKKRRRKVAGPKQG